VEADDQAAVGDHGREELGGVRVGLLLHGVVEGQQLLADGVARLGGER